MAYQYETDKRKKLASSLIGAGLLQADLDQTAFNQYYMAKEKAIKIF
jgi:hypothetical protein